MKQKFTIFLIVAVFYCTKFNSVNAQVNTQDSLALVALYNSTNGPNWTNHTNWLTTAPVSNWYGIQVTGNGVTSISLSANQLSGSIPVESGNLVSLETLDLEFNALSGSIPAQLGNIHSLADLDLEYNNLSDTIPSELGNTNLFYLYLNANSLTGKIPKELGNLTNLQAIDLSYNQLTGSIPAELGNLQNVFNLLLRFNKLSGSIPSELGNMAKLQGLDLNSNKLTGKIPSTLGNLPNLFRLALDNNQLSGKIPLSLSTLPNLLFLYLQYNKLSGTIPSSLGNSSKLVELKLSNNKLSGTVPSSLAQLNNLTSLRLDVNKFTFAGMGSIAKAFSFAIYSPQAGIKLNLNSNILSVSAGGTLSKNTYKWYKDGSLVATIKKDSTYQPTQSGNYSVAVTNSVATQLTLYSDTVNYVAANNLIASKISNKISSISLYPNPAKTNVTLSFNADGKYSITVTDVSGKILQTKTGVAIKGSTTIQLDVSNYASGLYLITIVDEKNNKQTVRLSKE